MTDRLTPAQLRAKAASYLRTEGHSLGEISAALGVSKTQVARMCEAQGASPVVGADAVTRAMDEWLERQEGARDGQA